MYLVIKGATTRAQIYIFDYRNSSAPETPFRIGNPSTQSECLVPTSTQHAIYGRQVRLSWTDPVAAWLAASRATDVQVPPRELNVTYRGPGNRRFYRELWAPIKQMANAGGNAVHK